MLEDLLDLNRSILRQAGAENGSLYHTLEQVTVCLGRLKATAGELTRAANVLTFGSRNAPDVTELNRAYLLFARQTCRDILGGYYSGIPILGLNDMEQVIALSELPTRRINDLAESYPGLIYEVLPVVRKDIGCLHRKAAAHYPAALLALAV